MCCIFMPALIAHTRGLAKHNISLIDFPWFTASIKNAKSSSLAFQSNLIYIPVDKTKVETRACC